MKNILLTGATGFVGRQIVKALSQQNVNIIVVVRPGKEINFKKITNIKKIISSQDIFKENENWWTNHCKGIDTIIHAAWYAEPGKYLQSSKNLDCLIGSLHLARGAANAGVTRFIGIGNQEGPINICSGASITVKQLAQQIADIYDKRHLLKFGVQPENPMDPLFVVGVPNYNLKKIKDKVT